MTCPYHIRICVFLVFSFSYDSEDSRDSSDSKQDDQMVRSNYIVLFPVEISLFDIFDN